MPLVLEARGVSIGYGRERVLHGADFAVGAGESVALVGPSGSGKTTLLYCLAGILVPDEGRIIFDGADLGEMSIDERAGVRLSGYGFVFQFAELVPELSLQENVELPLRLRGTSARDARSRAVKVLDRLGVSAVAHRRPGQVSGGQAQRIAVARAVIGRPAVILADEPTGSVDEVAGTQVLDELLMLARDAGSALVVVTHDDAVAAQMSRRVQMRDGRCEMALA